MQRRTTTNRVRPFPRLPEPIQVCACLDYGWNKGRRSQRESAPLRGLTRPDLKWKPCVPGLRSSYVIPVVAENGHNLGVLCFNSYGAVDFPPNLCKALNSFGELCSLLISRTVAEIEARVAQECQRSFQEAEDDSRLFQRAVEKARRLVSAKGVSSS
jgi:hypothetical protein